jgi:hypothetical protein
LSTDILDSIESSKPAPLTQADYDRMARLDNALKVLGDELEGLKSRAKAGAPLSKHTEKHGNVVLVFNVRNNKDLVATAAKFPIEEHPDKWTTPEPVLDLEAIAPKEIVTVPALTLGISTINE